MEPTTSHHPKEVYKYFRTFYPHSNVTIGGVERYENIIQVGFVVDGVSKTAYIPVDKENRMSDSNGCG